jgi:hypothetical protein
VNKNIFLIPILLLVLCFTAYATICSYVQDTDGTDFFSVSNTTYNYTHYENVDYNNTLFVAFTTITPRLNFSADFNETLNFGNTTDQHYNSGAWQLDYYNATNIKIYNLSGTDLTAYFSYTTGSSSLTCNNASLNTTPLYVTYNRTFVKNTDNLVGGYSAICTLCGSMYEQNDATPIYGQDIGLRVRDNDLAGFNWAVEWTITERTCNAETTCTNTMQPLFYLLGVVFVLIMLTIIYFAGMNLKNNSDTSGAVIMLVISIAILAIGTPIIFNLISNMHC